MAKIVFLFTVVPLLELWLLLTIGNLIGFWPTVGLAVGTALLGATLAKREGFRVLASWQDAVGRGRVPDEGLTGGLLVLLGAVLLITPGVLTDAAGLVLLFPPTRRRIADAVRKRFEQRFAPGVGMTSFGGFGDAGQSGGAIWSVNVVDFRSSQPFGSGAWTTPDAEPPRDDRRDVLDVEAQVDIVDEGVVDASRRLPR